MTEKLGFIKEEFEDSDQEKAPLEGYTLALGNPFEGITLEGFFTTAHDAVEYSEFFWRGHDYYIVPIYKRQDEMSEEAIYDEIYEAES